MVSQPVGGGDCPSAQTVGVENHKGATKRVEIKAIFLSNGRTPEQWL
jgi:hypothetical protein